MPNINRSLDDALSCRHVRKGLMRARKKQIRMTLQSRFLFVVAVFCIATLLGACVTPPTMPFRLPEIQYGDTSESMYLWTQGSGPWDFWNLQDFATITRINGTIIPSKIVPDPGDTCISKLIELPAGVLVVEILYSETIFIPYWGSLCDTTDKSLRVIAFTGEPNRIYAPFASDRCSREYFWIEDWGDYESDLPVVTRSDKYSMRTTVINNNLTQPVVADEAPRKGACD